MRRVKSLVAVMLCIMLVGGFVPVNVNAAGANEISVVDQGDDGSTSWSLLPGERGVAIKLDVDEAAMYTFTGEYETNYAIRYGVYEDAELMNSLEDNNIVEDKGDFEYNMTLEAGEYYFGVKLKESVASGVVSTGNITIVKGEVVDSDRDNPIVAYVNKLKLDGSNEVKATGEKLGCLEFTTKKTGYIEITGKVTKDTTMTILDYELWPASTTKNLKDTGKVKFLVGPGDWTLGVQSLDDVSIKVKFTTLKESTNTSKSKAIDISSGKVAKLVANGGRGYVEYCYKIVVKKSTKMVVSINYVGDGTVGVTLLTPKKEPVFSYITPDSQKVTINPEGSGKKVKWSPGTYYVVFTCMETQANGEATIKLVK